MGRAGKNHTVLRFPVDSQMEGQTSKARTKLNAFELQVKCRS